MMKFETAVMKRTFDDAEALAMSGRLWSSAIPTPEPLWRGLFKRQPPPRRDTVKDPILASTTDLALLDAASLAPSPERDEPIS